MIAALALAVALLATPAVTPPTGELIALVQRGEPSDGVFLAKGVPLLQEEADALGLRLRVVDVASGAPDGVTSTPAILYADHRGRWVYQGRWSTPERVRNFIRTCRVARQEDVPLVVEGVPVWRTGRTTIAAPIKITDLTGSPPAALDPDALRSEARAAIDAGMERFAVTRRAALGRTDRRFYLDFHPYRSESGELFVSTAIFSQFNCHVPVYESVSDAPVSGPWADREAVFAAAARRLEANVVELMASSDLGDGLTPVDASVPVRSWVELELPLPPAPAEDGRRETAADLEVPTTWVVDAEAIATAPAVQFRFPAPLDSYAGEATGLTGRLELDGARLESASGHFAVDVTTVTMGEADLDAYLLTRGMLSAERHPSSTFRMTRLVPSDSGATLAPATIVPAVLHGTFEMKGMAVDIAVAAQLEIIVGDDGIARLLLEGSWQIDLLEPFGIYGPDGGPPKASRTLLYTCRIVMKGAPDRP